MSKTSKNTTPLTAPSAAALSRAALAEAQDTHAARLAAHGDAVAQAEDYRARLLSGDDTVTAVDLMTADAETTWARLLAEGAAAQVKRAESRLINDDLRVGEVIADLLRELFSGHARVEVVAERRHVTGPDDLREAVAFVLQDKPSTDTGGILGGNIEVTFYRPGIVAPLDGHAVEEAARRRGYVLQTNGVHSAEAHGAHQDSARIRVVSVFEAVPVLDVAPDEGTARYVAQGVCGALLKAVRYTGERREVRYLAEQAERDAFADLTSCRILGAEQVGSAEHRTMVEASFSVRPSKYLSANPFALVRQAVEDCAGRVEPGAGRVVTVENIEVTDLVDQPFGRPKLQVTTRFVLAYRLADEA